MAEKTLKSRIKDYLPVSVARWYLKKRSFATGFKATGYDDSCTIKPQDSKYKNIISIQGFNYSGSGAVLDMLREYPVISVLGYLDTEVHKGDKATKGMKLSEIDIIRLSGGLFEIEKYLDSDNHFFNDALLNRTVKCFESSSLYRYSEEIRDLLYRFFANITSLRIENLDQPYYNGYLVGLNEIPDIYFLKKMSKDEYYELCKNLLTSIFNAFYQNGKEYLAADQLLSDHEYNYTRNKSYIPNLKTILVPRDPRDTYAWAVKKNLPQMEHNTVERFITWFKNMYVNVNPTEEKVGCQIVRYENLVLDYDNQEKKINTYLELESADHQLRQQIFNPAFSKRFVGIYKNMKGYERDFDIIREELSLYCNPLID